MQISISHHKHEMYNNLSEFHFNSLKYDYSFKNLKLNEKQKPIH